MFLCSKKRRIRIFQQAHLGFIIVVASISLSYEFSATMTLSQSHKRQGLLRNHAKLPLLDRAEKQEDMLEKTDSEASLNLKDEVRYSTAILHESANLSCDV